MYMEFSALVDFFKSKNNLDSNLLLLFDPTKPKKNVQLI